MRRLQTEMAGANGITAAQSVVDRRLIAMCER